MARNFDDSAGDNLSVGAAVRTVAPFTLFATIKSDDGADDFQVIGGFSQVGTANFWKWRVRTVSPEVECQVEQTMPPNNDEASTTIGVTTGTWHTAAFVEAAAADRRAFLDGGNKGTNTTSVIPKSIDTTSIGEVDDGSPSDRWSGDLGHYAIYDTGLDDAMAETFHAGVNPLRIQPDNLVAYYPLNGNAGKNLMGDSSFDMTVTGTTIAEEPPRPNSIKATA